MYSWGITGGQDQDDREIEEDITLQLEKRHEPTCGDSKKSKLQQIIYYNMHIPL